MSSVLSMDRRSLRPRRRPVVMPRWRPWFSGACEVWLEADWGVILYGGRVGNWVNRRSAAHPFGTDVGNEPSVSSAFRNGHDVVDFDNAVPEFLYAGDDPKLRFANGENFTLWLLVTTLADTGAIESLVLKCHAGATMIGSIGAKGYLIDYRGDMAPGLKATEILLKDSNGILRTAKIADDIAGSPHLIAVTFDWAGDIQPYLDGVAKTAKDISDLTGDAAGTDPLYLGIANNKTTAPFNGSIGAFGLFRKKQTAGERHRIEDYLAWRYAL